MRTPVLFSAIFLVFLAAALPACTEDTPALPYSIEAAYNCYQDESWTIATIEDALIGEWEHVYFSCFSGEMDEVPAGERQIVFLPDGRLEVYQDGFLERNATWTVVPRGNENFELETSQILPWLRGDIVLCEDLLVFFESYIDGCDNYFERL